MEGPALCSCSQNQDLIRKQSATNKRYDLVQNSDAHYDAFCTHSYLNSSLFHCIPRRVHVHDAIQHLAAVTQVRGHAGRVLVLIGVRFRNRFVHCGI